MFYAPNLSKTKYKANPLLSFLCPHTHCAGKQHADFLSWDRTNVSHYPWIAPQKWVADIIFEEIMIFKNCAKPDNDTKLRRRNIEEHVWFSIYKCRTNLWYNNAVSICINIPDQKKYMWNMYNIYNNAFRLNWNNVIPDCWTCASLSVSSAEVPLGPRAHQNPNGSKIGRKAKKKECKKLKIINQIGDASLWRLATKHSMTGGGM